LNLKLHFLDFEFAALVTRVATSSFYIQVIPPPQTMSHSLGRANKFPRNDKLGRVLNLTFVLGKKDAPKLEFGRKHCLKVCSNLRPKIPTYFILRKNIPMGLELWEVGRVSKLQRLPGKSVFPNLYLTLISLSAPQRSS
jgi:hypothetical protein